MQPSACFSCCHFRRHYVFSGDSAMATNCGHCIFSRGKHRRPGAPACDRYQPADAKTPPNRSQTIRYLTAELLDYVLHLPLPPKIEE